MNIRTQLNWQALCLATLLLLGSSIPGTAIRQNQSPKPQVANPTNGTLTEQQALRRRQFEPFARLLRSKQVPFEPEMLLESNWPKKLAPIFDQMPEMQEARYRAEPLAGVQLADTLYLPERVEIAGDTIILVRHLVFEGTEAVIKGNHRIALYPANAVGFLGTTLPKRKKGEGKNFQIIVDIPETRPPTKPGHITIDTSGRGYDEWVESIGGEEKLKELMKALRNPDKRVRDKAREELERLRTGVSIQQQGRDTSGAEGAMGAPGDDGTPPNPPNPPVRPKAPGGECTGDNNGRMGAEGAPGGTAGDGGTGKQGLRGGDATEQITYIPDGDSQLWEFKAMGGRGGKGGPGGFVYMGYQGGTGGEGGDGADCTCAQSGPGNGGQGGQGGRGGDAGRGGTGGPGGPGGDGKTITLDLPCRSKWTGSYTCNYNKGGGGEGGDSTPSGGPGLAGNPGKGGKAGTNTKCTSQTASPGDLGPSAFPGDPMPPGDPGPNSTDHGMDGSCAPTERQCEEPEPCPEVCDVALPIESGCPQAVDTCTYGGGGGCPPHLEPNDGCCCLPSPILLDVDGDGFASLTNALGGVWFDIGKDGQVERCAWTQQGSDDAWLALDRNGNGRIDNGLELFGNFTQQPPSDIPDGFLALAVFDTPANSGNGDGNIDASDQVYSLLRLWQDGNHNGISESSELLTLSQVGLLRLELQYQAVNFTDGAGNVLRYRGRTHFQSAPQIRTAWDISLALN